MTDLVEAARFDTRVEADLARYVADVEEMQKAWREAEGGKLLAFCRSGRRSAFACALAQRDEGASREDVEQRLTEAGFDYGPIVHLL